MNIQLSESTNKVTLMDLMWAVNQRYVEPDSIWVGLNVVSILSSYSAGQLNKLGYKDLCNKNYPTRIKNNWVGNWSDLITLVAKISGESLSQVEYQLKRFTHVNEDKMLSIRHRYFVDKEVFAQSYNLPKDDDGVFWMWDYHPITQQLRAIPMQLLKEHLIEYEDRCL